MTTPRTPRVLFTAGREPEYVRNSLILKGLRHHFPVTSVTGRAGSYLPRLAGVSARILRPPEHDVAFAGFFGQPLALLLRRRSTKPIILDAFISAYDTLCLDRRVAAPASTLGRLAFALDRAALRAASVVLTDTQAMAHFLHQALDVPEAKLVPHYLGYEPDVFDAVSPPVEPPGPFTVFYYGSFLPLQGVDVIVRAAKLLEPEWDLRFRIVGHGLTARETRALAERLGVRNVEWIGWLQYRELPRAIAESHLCLGGHFGLAEKAGRVIAGKTYQFLAMGRATVVGEGPANHELLAHGEHAYFCRRGDPEALAAAILELKGHRDRRQTLAESGQRLVRERFEPETQAAKLAKVVKLSLK
ncbi:MAG: glycosyltransferase [Chloroflexi bacterium]|nr:glycosyltransferase [Chloroflexota bacterium]